MKKWEPRTQLLSDDMWLYEVINREVSRRRWEPPEEDDADGDAMLGITLAVLLTIVAMVAFLCGWQFGSLLLG